MGAFRQSARDRVNNQRFGADNKAETSFLLCYECRKAFYFEKKRGRTMEKTINAIKEKARLLEAYADVLSLLRDRER